MAYTLTSLKRNYDHQCKKQDKIIEQMEKLDVNSEEYKELKEELKGIEANKRRTLEDLQKMGNKDPVYM